jgi:hypothetical protein
MKTREEALEYAAKFGLQNEVETLINEGYSPDEALYEWDLLCPYWDER